MDDGGPATVIFDSQTLPKQAIEGYAGAWPLDQDVKELADSVAKHSGLTLFGFDLVMDEHDGKVYVIDLNYFPSYEGMPEFERLFYEMLMSPSTGGSDH
jgi:hypothetical protein